MAKIITAKEAAQLIPDGATVACGGMGLSGWAEEIGCAIRDNFKETGHPCNLSIKQGSAMGDWKERGITRLGEAGPGLVTKWSAAHVGSAFSLNKLAVDNQLECWCLPQGVIVNLWREIAAGRPGMLTKVGLGTFVDPRLEGGRMNDVTKEDICKLVEFEGEEYLFYKSFQVDVAILRGTTADENGNVTFEHESVLNEGLSIAEAVKHCGGIVIVQVEYLAKKELLVQTLQRGFAWLDTGTHDSLSEASTFIEVIEKRQGLKVACLEEIAYKRGWISKEQVRRLAEPMIKNDYGRYLVNITK